MNELRVVVLMAAYQAEDYIDQAIDSILKQTFTNFELHVFDDGSSDATYKKAARNPDPRVHVHHWPKFSNKGKVACLNHLMSVTDCDYYMMMDADDVAHPRRIELNVTSAISNNFPALIMSGHELIINNRNLAPNGHYFTEQEVDEIFASIRMPAHDPTMFFEAKLGRRLGFDTELQLGEGVDFCQRLSENGRVLLLPDALYKYRINPSSITHKRASEKAKFGYMVVVKASQRRSLPVPSFEEYEQANRRWLGDDNNLSGHFLESVRYQLYQGDIRGAWTTVKESLTLLSRKRLSSYKPVAGFFLGLLKGWSERFFKAAILK